jgi:hypothetical protein
LEEIPNSLRGRVHPLGMVEQKGGGLVNTKGWSEAGTITKEEEFLINGKRIPLSEPTASHFSHVFFVYRKFFLFRNFSYT